MAALLVPLAANDPAGPDLSYSPERGAIEHAFERAASGAADDVDWKDTVAAITGQSQLTRDLWLAVYLARAGARSNRLTLVEDGCQALAGLMESFWDDVHPKLEEYGIEGRKAPCESLVRIGEFIGPLRRVVLVEHGRLGSFSGEDFERFAREGESGDGYGQFRAAIADTPVEQLQAIIDQLNNITDALTRADAVLSEQATNANQTGTNFEPTYEVLESIRNAVLPYVTLSTGAGDGAALEAEESGASDGGGGRRAGRPAGRAIESREDVARALDSVIDYYVRREPSSPIPAALGRIKGWIAMDFMALLRDISPNGVADADGVLRARIEENGRSDMM
ncbi:type VI secretion system protein TssA [Sphingomonas sp. ERG5]|uniref:type VI secretion system protein TssA n=1 Tax=Sphingomonas sp. ERG5 TaxID=1381597 RepID=UPI00054C5C40|nr:type VI secretion system ImpA family N-terminal domain-containing protein [Sphingomonas sp. ERG5]